MAVSAWCPYFQAHFCNIWPQKSNLRHSCHSAFQLQAIWMIFNSGAALIALDEIIGPI
jgi:hypothetical protein